MFISEDMTRRGGTLVRTNEERTTDERQLLLCKYVYKCTQLYSVTDRCVSFLCYLSSDLCLFCFCKTQKVLHSAQILCNL